MKKVMFLIVGMLFAASVNAATITIVNDQVDVNAPVSGVSPSHDPAGMTFTLYNNPDTDTWADGDFHIGTAVTTDTTGDYAVEWTFNQANDFSGGYISQGENSFAEGYGIADYPQAISGAYSYIISLVAGNTYFFDILGHGTDGLNVTLTVGAVPIPAALFLFAPALLGFFGLRRKAAVAA